MNTKLAYFAGLFDGEGHIGIRKSKPFGNGISNKYDLVIAIRMTDPRPIKAFKEFFNTRYRYETKHQNPNAKPIHVAYANCNLAEEIIKKLRPLLIVKAEEVDLALKFQECKRRTNCQGIIGFARRVTPPKFLEERHQFHLDLQTLKKRIIPFTV